MADILSSDLFSSQSGYSGYSGVSGFSGFSSSMPGTEGTSGYSGVSGFGESGYSGYSGQDGSDGTSGYSGLSGASTSGQSGFSGVVAGVQTNDVEWIDGYVGVSGQVLDGFSASIVAGRSYKLRVNLASSSWSGMGMMGEYWEAATPYTSLFSDVDTIIIRGMVMASGWATPYLRSYSGTGIGVSGSGMFSTSLEADFRHELELTPTSDGSIWLEVGPAGGVSGAASGLCYGSWWMSDDMGISGFSGLDGASTSGYSGYSGNDGSDGDSGTSGTSGYSGNNGTNGTNGDSGTSGFSGNGESGYSGYSGAGGSGVTWIEKAAAYTAVAGDGILADTSGGAWDLELPATPSIGDTVSILDATSSFDTENLTVLRNGSLIRGVEENLVCDSQDAAIDLVYSGDTVGWTVKTYPGVVGDGGGEGTSGFSGYSGASGEGTSGYSGYSGPAASGAARYYICPRESGASHAGGTYWSYTGWSAQVLSGQAYVVHLRPKMWCSTGSDTPFKCMFSGPAMASGYNRLSVTTTNGTPWAQVVNDINGIQWYADRNTVATQIFPDMCGILKPVADGWLVPWFYGDAAGTDWFQNWEASNGMPSVQQWFSLEEVTIP